MISKRHLVHLNCVQMNNYIAQFRSMQKDVSATNPESSKSNEEILHFMAQQFGELKKMFQEENATLRAQLNAVVKELAEQKVVIDRLSLQEAAEIPLSHSFPIETEEDLIKLNEAINDSNRDAYIKTMNIMLRPEGTLKSMRCILTDQFIMDFNIEGVQGKKSLKQYKNFYAALLKAIPISETSGPPEMQLRDAIKMQKNRVFKNICIGKKRKHKETLEINDNI